MQSFAHFYHEFKAKLDFFSGVPALGLRLYLAPIFIIAGYSKMQFTNEHVTGFSQIFANESIVQWFGNSEWGLGLPFAELLANLAAWFEFFGGWFLLFGFLTRLISIPLIFTMFMAATTVHLENGWFAITPTNGNTSPAKVFSWLGFEKAEQSLVNSMETGERLSRMKSILADHGNTNWLYENGSIVVLNNGVEFATTYFLMLLALFFIGAGRYTSIDYFAFYSLTSRIQQPKRFDE